MQPRNTLPAIPLAPPRPSGAEPSDMIAAIVGASRVDLAGFRDETAMPGSWTHPNEVFLSAAQFAKNAAEVAERSERWKRLLGWLYIGGASLVSFALGAGAAAAMMDWQQAAAVANAGWRVTDVRPDAVVLLLDGKTVAVPVGSRLPNGELVVSVAPERRAAYLEGSIIVLRQAAKKESEK